MKNLKSKLISVIKEYPNSIKAAVAEEALKYSKGLEKEDIEFEDFIIALFFRELLRLGCKSGIIESLSYYNQTTKFYDDHIEEISHLEENYNELKNYRTSPNHHLYNRSRVYVINFLFGLHLKKLRNLL